MSSAPVAALIALPTQSAVLLVTPSDSLVPVALLLQELGRHDVGRTTIARIVLLTLAAEVAARVCARRRIGCRGSG